MWSRAEMCITVQYTVALVDVLVQYKLKCERRVLCNEICAHIISFIVSAFADSMIISKNCKHARECSIEMRHFCRCAIQFVIEPQTKQNKTNQNGTSNASKQKNIEFATKN